MADVIIVLIVIILLGLALRGSITVTNALNGFDGVTAKVSLKENSAEVSYDREIDLADLKNAVKNAGYEVTSIS